MTTTVFTGTPVITVTDNRSLAVRTLNWNRTVVGDEATLLVTHSLATDDSLTLTVRDPRLFRTWLNDSTSAANLTTFSSLTDQPLRRDSTDSGRDVTMYDAEGRPVWSRDPAGTIMQWAYDELGRPVSRLQQLPGATETATAAVFIYGDDDPQTINPQDHNLRGVCIRQYDEGGLLTHDSIALSGAALSTAQTFLQDAESLPAWPDDEAGRALLLEDTVYITTVQADAIGRTVAQTDASGHTVSITYDVSGVPVTQSLLLKNQSTPATVLLSGLTLSAAGQVLKETAGNGITTTYSYEEDTLRLSGITTVRGSDSAMLQSLEYAYDPAGNVTSVTDTTVSTAWFRSQATDGTREFTYDALYQLISASGRENAANGIQTSLLPTIMSLNDSQYINYARNYTYDDSGNLATLTHTGAVNSTMALVTDTASNRSIRQDSSGSLTPDTVSWDSWFTPGGQLRNLQTGGGKSSNTGYSDATDALTWDRNSRLQAMTLVSRSTTDMTQNDRELYQYRGGMRVRKQTRTLTNTSTGLWTVNEVRYLPGLEIRNNWQETAIGKSKSAPTYSEQLEVVTTQAGRSEIRTLHWITTPPPDISNDQIRYEVDDNLGSMQLELDGSGQIISREEYYPYGGTAVWAARSETEASYKVIRYSGRERDGAGLYYYGYRYYAPWLCRWTASDPAGEVDGLNLFCMVGNNPVTMRDIAGLAPSKLFASFRRKRINITPPEPVGIASFTKGSPYHNHAAQESERILKEEWDMARLTSPQNFDPENFRLMVHAIPAKTEYATYSENINDESHQKRSAYLQRVTENPKSALQEKEYLSASIISNENPNSYASMGFIISVPVQNILIARNHDINFENNKGDLRYPELQHGKEASGDYKTIEERNAAIIKQIQAKRDPVMTMDAMFNKARSSENGNHNEIIFTPKGDVHIHPGMPQTQSVEILGAFIISPNGQPPLPTALNPGYREEDINLEAAQQRFVAAFGKNYPQLPILKIKGSAGYR